MKCKDEMATEAWNEKKIIYKQSNVMLNVGLQFKREYKQHTAAAYTIYRYAVMLIHHIGFALSDPLSQIFFFVSLLTSVMYQNKYGAIVFRFILCLPNQCQTIENPITKIPKQIYSFEDSCDTIIW